MQKEETRQGYSAEYAYDASGASTYFRAGVGSRSAVLSDGAAAYTPGISERRNNVSRFYTLNAQGSTTQLTDSSQDETASFSYDAWGNRIGTRNSDDPPFLFGGGFGYETDDDAGLIWVGSKPFFPKIGRFISRSGGGSAVYGGGYAPVGNNPVISPGGGISVPSGSGPSGPVAAPLEVPWLDDGPVDSGWTGSDPDAWLQTASNFFAGWGDGLTWNTTKLIRDHFGIGGVEYDSTSYTVGTGVGVAHQFAILGAPRPLRGAPTVVLGPGNAVNQHVAVYGGIKYGGGITQKILPSAVKNALTFEIKAAENSLWLIWKLFAGYNFLLLPIDSNIDSPFYRREIKILKGLMRLFFPGF
jgi:YD repeat-containing protein